MTVRFVWSIVVALVALCAALPVVGAEESAQAELSDFLIFAIAPDADDKTSKLVEVGDKSLDEAKFGRLVKGLPFDFWGLTSRDHDEAAERSLCEAACKANARCRDVVYVRPSENRPLGACHLKAAATFGVMAPVGESGDVKPSAKSPVIVVSGAGASGDMKLGTGEGSTPVTFRFETPVASAKLFIRAAPGTGQKAWAVVEAFDQDGKLAERSGTWVPVGEMGVGQAVALSGKSDRFASVKVSSREPGLLFVEGIEYGRTFVAGAEAVRDVPKPASPEAIAPPVLAPAPAAETQQPLPDQTGAPLVAEVPVVPTAPTATAAPVPAPPSMAPPVREEIPPPPEVPPADALNFPLPPRAVATDVPRDITIPVDEPISPPTEIAAPAPVVAPVQRTAPVGPRRGLPIWLAIGAVGAMFAGALLYARNHNVRTRARLTTRLVSTGLDRQTIEVEDNGAPELSLRVVVSERAAIAAPSTRIQFIPHGAPA